MKFCVVSTLTVFAILAVVALQSVHGEENRCGCECMWPCCCVCAGPPAPPQCNDRLCLTLLVDQSGSINTHLPKVKEFLKQLLGSFVSTMLSTACVAFESNATVLWDFGDPASNNRDLAEAAIDSIELGKFTNLVEGMEATINQVLNGPRPDPGCTPVVVIFTDGRAQFRQDEYQKMCEELKKHAYVAVVSVTDNIYEAELKGAATSGTFANVDDFDHLLDLIDPLVEEICEDVVSVPGSECECCCPPPFPVGPPKYRKPNPGEEMCY